MFIRSKGFSDDLQTSALRSAQSNVYTSSLELLPALCLLLMDLPVSASDQTLMCSSSTSCVAERRRHHDGSNQRHPHHRHHHSHPAAGNLRGRDGVGGQGTVSASIPQRRGQTLVRGPSLALQAFYIWPARPRHSHE